MLRRLTYRHHTGCMANSRSVLSIVGPTSGTWAKTTRILLRRLVTEALHSGLQQKPRATERSCLAESGPPAECLDGHSTDLQLIASSSRS